MELYHHGIKGQKWGVRRFQNKDGTLTTQGRYHKKEQTNKKGLSDKQKTALKVGAAVIGTALVAYGGYKLATSPKGQEVINGLLKKDLKISEEGFGGMGLKQYMSKSITEKESLIQSLNPGNGCKNCQACAGAFDVLMRTGEAIGIKPSVDTRPISGDDFMRHMYKNFTGFKTSMPADNCKEFAEELTRNFGSLGDNVYGRINLKSVKGGSGHAIAFYMQKGEPRFVDSQFRKDLSAGEVDKYFGRMVDWMQVGYARTDNLDLADNAIDYLKGMK